ncbi:ABC transporter ATP-binding protein [Desulfococcus sp.]|uniref:ABC transporter ATP-binding protein n=1 Tax=Desulfococcus sp. TaxID=2025834 RepID=UPI003593BE72
MTGGPQMPLLEIEGLKVRFTTRSGVVRAVRGVSLHVAPGETLGLVGESGSGKSVTVQAAMGLVQTPGEIVAGDVRWKGRSFFGRGGAAYLRQVRGKEISMIFQDPMTSLNPVFTVGAQICEVLRHHLGMSGARAKARAVELLSLVNISAPEKRLKQYPDEFSGGMRQRVMIAMAMACEPELLIADEPTTALDVTIQAQILELMADLQSRLNLSVILISHDLGVVAQLCNRVAVMYAGEIVEVGPVDAIFHHPVHPYTRGLLRATPSLEDYTERMITIEGVPPDLISPPEGCAFFPRCARAGECCVNRPRIRPHGDGHHAACWCTSGEPSESGESGAPDRAEGGHE